MAEAGQSLSDAVKTARDELAAAQRSRSELQERLNRATAELDKLKAQAQRDQRRIATLENERAHLQLRLKDRDEELREKAKLLDVRVHFTTHSSRSLKLVLILSRTSRMSSQL